MNIRPGRENQFRLTQWTAYAIATVWAINLLGHIIYASVALVPFGRSHSMPVESLGAAAFFLWSLFALGVYRLLEPRASGLARWALALGIVGFLYLSVLHILFVFEVLWFSNSIALFLLGCSACAVWAITVLYLTRDQPNRVQGNVVVNVLLTLLSILAYPPWPILLWRRIVVSEFKGERSHA